MGVGGTQNTTIHYPPTTNRLQSSVCATQFLDTLFEQVENLGARPELFEDCRAAAGSQIGDHVRERRRHHRAFLGVGGFEALLKRTEGWLEVRVVPSLDPAVEAQEVVECGGVRLRRGPVPERHVLAEGLHIERQIQVGLRRDASTECRVESLHFIELETGARGDVERAP